MKKIVTFIVCLGYGLVFSQTKGTETPPTGTSASTPEERKQAEYPGGINVFMREVSRKINTRRIKGGAGQAKASAKFSVNTRGEIDQLQVTGNNETVNKEIERVMRSITTQWIPGTYKGSPVEIWYNLPFIINFE